MCRTADDCGLVLAALAGRDPLDPTTSGRAFAYPEQGPAPKRFRVGVLRGATDGVQPGVRQNFEAALRVLGEIAQLEQNVTLPDLPFGPAIHLIIGAEGASAFRDLLENGRVSQLRAANDKWGGYPGTVIPAVDYLQALRVRTRMKREMDTLYSRYDALVAPSRSTVAYPLAVDFDRAYPDVRGGSPLIPAGNLVGQPAVSLPNGFGPDGLPTGFQLTGRAWGEARLLRVAAAYQRATDWHTRRPRPDA
jgi:aspartyl-tRNA(Asn)/glutamyl-tRNA(Gln) amidotransferase subunit A